MKAQKGYALKMKKLHFILSIVIVLFCALPAMAMTLKVVTLYSPPLSYEERGNVVGFAAELVREGVRRIGHEADITIMPWKRALFMTRFGEADAIFYAVKTKEREQWFYYPEEFLVVETTVILQRANENLNITPDKRNFPNVRLGVGRGYYYGPKLKDFVENSTFEAVEEANSIETNFAKLLERRIDIFLADFYLARHFINKNASKDVVEIIRKEDGFPLAFDSVKAYLAFSKETMSQDIADAFSKALAGMKQDGTYKRILDTYR